MICTVAIQQTINDINEKEYDNHYRYTVNYYTCRQYYIHK